MGLEPTTGVGVVGTVLSIYPIDCLLVSLIVYILVICFVYEMERVGLSIFPLKVGVVLRLFLTHVTIGLTPIWIFYRTSYRTSFFYSDFLQGTYVCPIYNR